MLRRLFFDLTGLPPTPEQLEAFLADERPDAYARLVDQLLESPHFGERWARHWLDLVRYAETHGHEFDYPIRHAWRYRDYVIRAINADVPYDRFATEHIAGDLLENPRRHPTEGFDESIIGTGFWYLSQGTHAPVDVRGDEAERIDNQIDVFSKTFLGVTVSCARCHDHKFDPVTTRDFYALAGFLQSSRRQEAYLDPNGRIAAARRRLGALADELDGLPGPLVPAPRDASGVALRAAAAAGAIRSGRAAAEAEAAAGDDAEEEQDEAERTRGLDAAIIAATSVAAEADGLDPDTLARWVAALRDARVGHEQHPLHELIQALLRDPADEDEPAASPPAPVDPPGASAVFASFDDTLEGWHVAGHAFEAAPTSAGQCRLGAERLQLSPTGAAHSGRLAGRLQGTMRSPTFPIDSEFIAYRVSGRGRIRLIIDGYVLDEFNPLLFEGMSFDVRTVDDGWIEHRQRVGRYRGHRAHIELVDDTDGFLVVDEIRFEDGPPSGPARAGWALDATGDAAARLEAACTTSLRRWREGRPGRADVALINWLLAHELTGTDDAAARLVDEAQAIADELPAPVRVLAITDGTGEDEHVFIRGNHRTPGEAVPRRFIESLAAGQTPIDAGSGRRELAARVFAPENPLPARVAVNRVWLHLFGQGLVPTPDDLGALGRPPTHPELLDWLAVWLREEADWSMKKLIRLLVTSRAYRMSSVAVDPPIATRVDPENQLLHRARTRRLEAEAIRDAILAVSGRLDPTLEGPPVPLHLTPFMTGRGRPGRNGPLDGDGRRSIYIEVRRNFLAPMMSAFDAPVPASTIGRRHRSNVPAQALILLNDPFVVEQSRSWAQRLLSIPDLPPAQRIESMYLRAFARPPTDEELELARSFLQTQAAAREASDWTTSVDAWADYAHVLFNTKEFVFLQ
jgi:hypothetical protein